MSLSKGIHHISVKVCDLDASVDFYTNVLEFKLAKTLDPGRGVLLDTGNGVYLELFGGAEPGEKSNGAVDHFALWIDDVDFAIDKVRKAGGTITLEPKDHYMQSTPSMPMLRIGFIKGPGGERVEFYCEKA